MQSAHWRPRTAPACTGSGRFDEMRRAIALPLSGVPTASSEASLTPAARYIRLADEFVNVPGGSNRNNYANVELIVKVARRCEANAVWPVRLAPVLRSAPIGGAPMHEYASPQLSRAACQPALSRGTSWALIPGLGPRLREPEAPCDARPPWHHLHRSCGRRDGRRRRQGAPRASPRPSTSPPAPTPPDTFPAPSASPARSGPRNQPSRSTNPQSTRLAPSLHPSPRPSGPSALQLLPARLCPSAET